MAWLLAQIFLHCFPLLICACLTFLLIGYLMEKPWGLQTLMDEFNKMVFGAQALLQLTGTMQVLLVVTQVDLGNFGVQGFVYLRAYSVILFPTSIMTNAIIQYLLIHKSWVFNGYLYSDQSLACLSFATITLLVSVEVTLVSVFLTQYPHMYTHFEVKTSKV